MRFGADVEEAATRAILDKAADRLGIVGVRPHRRGAFIVSIDDACDGRCYAVSRSLAALETVDYAEPNHIVILR